jgi:outer membrane protein TolC
MFRSRLLPALMMRARPRPARTPLARALVAPTLPAHGLLARTLLPILLAGAPLGAAAALAFDEAQQLARQSAPVLRAQQASVEGSGAALAAAGTLPDPRLSVGIDNLPVQGMDAWSTTRDSMTMQRVTLMQEVPNRAKRDARVAMGQARIERDRALLVATRVQVGRDAALAWLAVHYAEKRQLLLAEFRRENRLLQDTLAARIAAMRAMPADLTMARQDALMIDDRADQVARDIHRARAELRRWVGERAAEPLAGEPALPPVQAEALRARLEQAAELRPFAPMREMASAEMSELAAEARGDWAWELSYSRRPKYDDMVSVMLRFDLPWQRERRQQPAVDAKRREVERVEHERDEMARRLAGEADAMLAELRAMEAMHARQSGPGLQLAAERIALATAGYEAGRGDLGQVLAARAQALETRMKVIELDAERAALRVRLAALVAEE